LISGYCSQFSFEERLQNFVETPDLFLLELACSETGLVSTHHLLVVKSLIFKAMISSPCREGGQRDSAQQQCFSLRCKPNKEKKEKHLGDELRPD